MVKKTKKDKNQIKRPQPAPYSIAKRNNMILFFIVGYTLFLFYKSANFQFVNWDDNFYVIDNELIREFSLDGIKKIFTTPVLGMYNPLPFLIYNLTYKYSGLDPKTFHIINILLHLLACVVLFKFIFNLSKRYETAVIVTLLFAIHPMHVGVVTWVSQTKTSLMFIFYMLALGQYLKYLQQNYQLKYLIYTGLLFILAVLSKPDAVTLAPMLFLMDYYCSRKFDKKMVVEKIPFFIISLCFGLLTIFTHSEVNDTIFDVNQNYTFINQLLISNYSIVFYINKFVVPLNLSAIYTYPENTLWLPLKYYLAIPVIPFILFLIYKAGRFRKEMIFGILFFIISISLLIRIVPSGFFSAANRYSYLSYTGLFFIIGQYITYLLDNKFSYAFRLKPYIISLFAVAVVLYSYKTTVRVKKWQNTITLFDDVISKEPKVQLAYNNRALAKLELGDLNGAIKDLDQAIVLDSTYTEAIINRGVSRDMLGNSAAAIEDFSRALTLNPLQGSAYYNRALAKETLNDAAGAWQDLLKADSLGVKMARDEMDRLRSESDSQSVPLTKLAST